MSRLITYLFAAVLAALAVAAVVPFAASQTTTTTTTTAISLPRNETLYIGAAMWYTPTNWNPFAPSGAAEGVFGYIYWPLFFWSQPTGYLLPAMGKWYGIQMATYSASVPISVSVSGGTATITLNATSVQKYTTTINLANVPSINATTYTYMYLGNIVNGSPQFIGITSRGNVTVTVVNATAVVGASTAKTITVPSTQPVFFNITVVYPTQLSVSNQYTLLANYAPGNLFSITPVPQTTLPVFQAPFNATASKFIVLNLTGVTSLTIPDQIDFGRSYLVVMLWPGEYWQDGVPVTSKDIVFTWYYKWQYPSLGDAW
ncbi:MAG: hypothetical protein TU35_004925, partial [Thermoproteus sp. AZ2]